MSSGCYYQSSHLAPTTVVVNSAPEKDGDKTHAEAFLFRVKHFLILRCSVSVTIKPANDNNSYTMDIETHRHELAPFDTSHEHISGRHDLIGQMLPPILKCQGGLRNIPHDTLRQNLQPVIRALEKLDSELLLGLQPAEYGPRLREG